MQNSGLNIPAPAGTDIPTTEVTGATTVLAIGAVGANTAPAVTGLEATEVTNTNKRLSKTDKWKQIEAEIQAILSNPDLNNYPNVQSLVTKVIDFYKPKSGGGALKDWSRRIEDSLGKIVAKECEYTKLWYLVDEDNIKDSAFSKGKYVTKKLLGLIREIKDEIQAEAVSLMMQGQVLNDQNKLIIFNPNSKESEVFTAINALYPDRVANVANEYSEEGKYLGANKEEAKNTLIGKGRNDLVLEG